MRWGASSATAGCFKADKVVMRSGIYSRCERRPNSERLDTVGCENAQKRLYTTMVLYAGVIERAILYLVCLHLKCLTDSTFAL